MSHYQLLQAKFGAPAASRSANIRFICYTHSCRQTGSQAAPEHSPSNYRRPPHSPYCSCTANRDSNTYSGELKLSRWEDGVFVFIMLKSATPCAEPQLSSSTPALFPPLPLPHTPYHSLPCRVLQKGESFQRTVFCLPEPPDSVSLSLESAASFCPHCTSFRKERKEG